MVKWLWGWRKWKPEKVFMTLTLAFLVLRNYFSEPHTGSEYIKAALGLLMLLFIGAGLYQFIKKRKWQKVANMNLSDVDAMSEREFKDFMIELLRMSSYSPRKTFREREKVLLFEREGVKTAVELKREKNTVGVTVIQQAIDTVGKYNCDNGLVISISNFTRAAKTLAFANRIALWDRRKLERQIALASKDIGKVELTGPLAGK